MLLVREGSVFPSRPWTAARRFVSSILLATAWAVTSSPARSANPSDAPLTATAAHGMVVSRHPLATRAGLEVLKAGGNAVDAAVATALALAVVHPQAGNLGGGGFLMYYRAKDSLCTLIDFRETAPRRARAEMYLDAHGNVDTVMARVGHLSAGVPGTPAGLFLAWSKYGRQSWRSLVAPAVRLAQDGFKVNADLASAIREEEAPLRADPGSAAIYLPHGKPLRTGDKLVQKDLARTLRLLAQSGALTFYEGAVAELILQEMGHGSGILSREDLASYRAIERAPLRGHYRDLQVLAPPPPSSGGVTLLETLAQLEYYDMSAVGSRSTYRVHLAAEAMARAFADRNAYLGDPDFVRVPTRGLLDRGYIATLQRGIDIDAATPAERIGPGNPWAYEPPGPPETMPAPAAAYDTLKIGPGSPGHEGDHTTHVSIVDTDGNCVSLTTTLNSWFGSGVTVAGAGFLLNNEMDDFSAKPGAPNQFELVSPTDANAIAPGKRMLSSMTPVVVLRGGKPWLVLGSPGGPRIISTVLNILLDVRDHGLTLQEAVASPRFHDQWQPDVILHEPGAFTDDVRENLRQMGHTLRERPPWSSAQCIEIDTGGLRHGVSDPRTQGAALGY